MAAEDPNDRGVDPRRPRWLPGPIRKVASANLGQDSRPLGADLHSDQAGTRKQRVPRRGSRSFAPTRRPGQRAQSNEMRIAVSWPRSPSSGTNTKTRSSSPSSSTPPSATPRRTSRSSKRRRINAPALPAAKSLGHDRTEAAQERHRLTGQSLTCPPRSRTLRSASTSCWRGTIPTPPTAATTRSSAGWSASNGQPNPRASRHRANQAPVGCARRGRRASGALLPDRRRHRRTPRLASDDDRRRYFEEIEPQLYRFPAIDPRAFRERVEQARTIEPDLGQAPEF
jgi:hypothetical protein